MGRHLYYENHQSVEWARIKLYQVTAPPTFVKHVYEIPFPRAKVNRKDCNNGKNTFSKFNSVFFSNRRKTSHKETCGECGEVSPISNYVLYNLPSQVFSNSFSTIIQTRALSSAMVEQNTSQEFQPFTSEIGCGTDT